MTDLESQLASQRLKASEQEATIKTLQKEVSAAEEARGKEEERESKLKALLSKAKQNYDTVRQQLSAKEAEMTDIVSQVIHTMMV